MKSTAGGYVLGRGDPHGRQMRSAPPRLELKKAEFEGNFMIAKKRIFVAGGAGNQGGAVISALLERGHEARTMARMNSAAPKWLGNYRGRSAEQSNRHSPDDIQIRGNRTTAPSPRGLCSHCSHPMT